MIRTYSELMKLDSFEDRFRYLQLNGNVAEETFGFNRYVNQVLYHSDEWDSLRNHIIIRDLGCDLAHPDHEIHGKILVHHMNPITKKDIVERSKFVLDPEFLITTTLLTHNAIHYGDYNLTNILVPERSPHDMCPWR